MPSPDKPVERPGKGDEYQPRGQCSVNRFLNTRYQVTGVEHCTADFDLQAMYLAAHLATRHALRIHHRDHSDDSLVELRFIEIGSWVGESAAVMAAAIEDAVAMSRYTANCTIYLVDRFTGTLGEASEIVARGFSGNVLEYCLDNVAQIGYRRPGCVDFSVDLIIGDSVQSATSFLTPVDYVFVDADHSYAGCKGDIEAYWPTLKPGAIMAGHDYGLLFPDVIVAADECCQRLAGSNPLIVEGSSVWMTRKPTYQPPAGDNGEF